MDRTLRASIRLSPAGAGDEPFLFRVYASTRQEELDRTGWTEPEREAFLQQQYDVQGRAYRQRFPDSGYQVILVADQPVGRFFLHHDADEIRIVDIAILPEHRNQGIGGTLIQAVLEEARATGRPVRASVELDNPALRLYERLGFVKVGHLGGYHALETWHSGTPPAG